MHANLCHAGRGAIPLHAVGAADAARWLAGRKGGALAAASGFAGAEADMSVLEGYDGAQPTD